MTDPARGDAPARPPPPAAAYGADLVLVGVCGWFLWRDYADAAAGDVAFQARTWTFMLNLTCAFVLVHRGLALVQRGIAGADVIRALNVLKWVLVLVLPVLVALHVERMVQRAHRENVDALAADVAARAARGLDARGAVTADDLSSLASPYLSALTVRTDAGAFLLEVSLPAFDIDGYVGRYSSTEGRWHVHHADLDADTEPAFDAGGPTLVCRPASGRLACDPSARP